MVAVPLGVLAGETVPHGAGEQVTDHVTPLFVESFVTSAVNCAVVPPWTVIAPGETVTLTTRGGALVPPPHPKLLRAIAMRLIIGLADKQLFGFIAASSTHSET